MRQDGDSDEDGDEGEVPDGRHVALLVGGVQGVPASHGGVERNRLAIVTVLKNVEPPKKPFYFQYLWFSSFSNS
jgi:hypothetical protein